MNYMNYITLVLKYRIVFYILLLKCSIYQLMYGLIAT